MDDDHRLAAARYVPMNPVRADMVARPEDWRWSSARAHLAGEDDGIVSVAPLAAWIDDLERATARRLARERRGPKPKAHSPGDVHDLFQTGSP